MFDTAERNGNLAAFNVRGVKKPAAEEREITWYSSAEEQ